MIRLDEIAVKLNEVLNNVNNPVRIDNARVAFMVATEGFRIDSIADRQLGKNLIPVFIAASGGENNPVEGLKQQTKSINIGIWYPLKYKDNFYVLEDYLDDVFVGKLNNLGNSTGSCLTNLGTAEFGEITDGNFTQFEKWITSKYKKTLDVTMAWFSMTLTLYATKTSSGFMFGNEIKFRAILEFIVPNFTAIVVEGTDSYMRDSINDKTIDGVLYLCWKKTVLGGYEYRYTIAQNNAKSVAEYMTLRDVIKIYSYDTNEMVDTGRTVDYVAYDKNSQHIETLECNLIRADAGTGANISPIAQQRIDTDSYAKNVANITNFNKSMLVYPNINEDFWIMFLTLYNLQQLDYIVNMGLIKDYGNNIKYYYDQMLLDIKENAGLGSPLTFTLTFGDADNG